MFTHPLGVVADLQILTAADWCQFVVIQPLDVFLYHEVGQTQNGITQVFDFLIDLVFVFLLQIDDH